jgi:hypothetical protein
VTGALDRATQSFAQRGHLAVGALLALAFVTGGGSMDRGTGDVLTQLLALPLLVWAALVLASRPRGRLETGAIAAALLIVVTLAVQQLPLGESLWRSVDARDALAADLDAAGVEAIRYRWSLAPLASEAAGWFILPGLAMFLGGLALPAHRHRGLLLLVVALVAGSVVLAFLQLGAPQDSVLNPFPQWKPAFGGFFSNFNTQATALGISIVAIAALLYDQRGREHDTGLPRWQRVALGLPAVLMLASLPLTTSRAMMSITFMGLAAVPFLLRGGRSGRTVPRAARWLAWAAVLAVGLAAVAIGIGWLQWDLVEEVRLAAAQATFAIGNAHLPLGAGVGSFITLFDQSIPESLFFAPYFNHAHNEYAQWWMETGVAAVACLAAALAVVIGCVPGPGRTAQDRGVAVAAWLGCVLVLLHSFVDYPLRTAALMSVVGVLLAIPVSQAGGRQQKPRPAN